MDFHVDLMIAIAGFEAYLIEAIARTGVHRYRYLCLEHPDPEVRRQYQRLVIDIATGMHAGDRHDPTKAPQPSGSCCGDNPMAL